MAMSVNLTLDPESLGYPNAKPIRNAWEAYVNQEVCMVMMGTINSYAESSKLLLIDVYTCYYMLWSVGFP